MTKLTNIHTQIINGAHTQIALLPLNDPTDNYFSDWIAFNGNADDYEIRWRLPNHALSPAILYFLTGSREYLNS